jgi:hypothetical protein
MVTAPPAPNQSPHTLPSSLSAEKKTSAEEDPKVLLDEFHNHFHQGYCQHMPANRHSEGPSNAEPPWRTATQLDEGDNPLDVSGLNPGAHSKLKPHPLELNLLSRMADRQIARGGGGPHRCYLGKPHGLCQRLASAAA